MQRDEKDPIISPLKDEQEEVESRLSFSHTHPSMNRSIYAMSVATGPRSEIMSDVTHSSLSKASTPAVPAHLELPKIVSVSLKPTELTPPRRSIETRTESPMFNGSDVDRNGKIERGSEVDSQHKIDRGSDEATRQPDTPQNDLMELPIQPQSQQETLVCIQEYDPVFDDELALSVGDYLLIYHKMEDGWAEAIHLGTNKAGVVPLNFLSRITIIRDQLSAKSNLQYKPSLSSPQRSQSLHLKRTPSRLPNK
ncbi:hypothetical protein EDD86DRAFT_216282 [Gorgonomyces haynaldii]|nr:hypothetical protein EDD86DRAFT_216282 [Gorgonomyces haynaldii]